MDFEKAYAVDIDAAEKGKWLTTRGGLNVKVGKLGNPGFKSAVQRLQKPHLALLRSEADTAELVDKITAEAMAEAILFDWEAESNGEPIPYTPKLGKQYMLQYPDFMEDVSELSATRVNFAPEELAEK